MAMATTAKRGTTAMMRRIPRRPGLRGLGVLPAPIPFPIRTVTYIPRPALPSVYFDGFSPLAARAPVSTAPLAATPSLTPAPVSTPAPVVPTQVAAAESIAYAADQGVSVAPFGPGAPPSTASAITGWLNSDSLIAGVPNLWLAAGGAIAAFFLLRKKRGF